MSVTRTADAFLALRDQRQWRLLAADHGPLVLAMLDTLFGSEIKLLPVSVAQERLTRCLDDLRANGHSLAQTAPAYLADWLAQGWLVRRLPPGAGEEVYEPGAEALAAIRWAHALRQPRQTATESRLASVLRLVVKLAEETDTDPRSRIERLKAERARIDHEIAAVASGAAAALSDERALERALEVIDQARELAADFRNVRDAFERLNRRLRQDLLENEGSRGEVLEQMFAGVDLIADSDAGRTFNAFWRLLTDAEQSLALGEALEAILTRSFARRLAPPERRFLQSLTAVLMGEGGEVHEVLQHFARSLKSFVQSREFQEQRRLHAVLREAQQAALAARERVSPGRELGFSLSLTSSRMGSVSQWALYDPSERLTDLTMQAADTSDLTLDAVRALLAQSEIDFRTLRAHVAELLTERAQVTLAELLDRFPAEQGLGSVVGYVALAARDGELLPGIETITWTGVDGTRRHARVPRLCFLRERSSVPTR